MEEVNKIEESMKKRGKENGRKKGKGKIGEKKTLEKIGKEMKRIKSYEKGIKLIFW